jgi:hypothetical protein
MTIGALLLWLLILHLLPDFPKRSRPGNVRHRLLKDPKPCATYLKEAE